MIGFEILNRIQAEYPEEKPLVFNYAEARKELLELATRIIILESMLTVSDVEGLEEIII